MMSWIDFVQLVAVPAFGFAIFLAWKAHNRAEAACEDLQEFKVTVARDYASITYLKDVESRLTAHLVRIEDKLDVVDRRGHPGE